MTTHFRALTPIEFVDPELANMQVGDIAPYNHEDDGLRLILERGMIELVESPYKSAFEPEVFEVLEVVETDKAPEPVKKAVAKKPVAKKAPAKKTAPKA